jgi:hypothetical protein
MKTEDRERIAGLPHEILARVNGGAELAGTLEYYRRRADAAFEIHEAVAPPPLPGESVTQYRGRLLNSLCTYAAADNPFKAVDFTLLKDTESLTALEGTLIADAVADFEKPTGPLRTRMTIDPETGARRRMFFGSPGACWDQFKPQTQKFLRGFRTASGARAPGAHGPVPTSVTMSDGSVRSI